MCICKVNTCCGCLDLKTGCCIIAFLFMINGVSAVFMIFSLGTVKDKDLRVIISKMINGIDIDIAVTIVKVLWIAILVLGILHVFITGTLFYGLIKNKRAWLRPFVIFHNIINSMQVLGLIIGFVTYFHVSHFFFMFGTALNIYFTIIVNSYYKQMGISLPPPVTCSETNYHELDNLSHVADQETIL